MWNSSISLHSGGSKPIQLVAVSPNGMYVAFICETQEFLFSVMAMAMHHRQVIVMDAQAHTEIKRMQLETDEFNQLCWCEGRPIQRHSPPDGRSLLVLDCEVRLTKFEGVIPEGMISGIEAAAAANAVSSETVPKTTAATTKGVVSETAKGVVSSETAKAVVSSEEEEVVTVRKLRRELPAEENPPAEPRDALGGVSTEDAFDGYQPEVVAPINAGARGAHDG